MSISSRQENLNQTFRLRDFSDNENEKMNRPEDQKPKLKGVLFFIYIDNFLNQNNMDYSNFSSKIKEINEVSSIQFSSSSIWSRFSVRMVDSYSKYQH
jgi:hypothetical protein